MKNAVLLKENIQKIIEYSPDAILITDSQFITIKVNEDAKKILRATENELNGRLLQFILLVGNNFIKNQFQQNLILINAHEFQCIRVNGSGFPANLKFKCSIS